MIKEAYQKLCCLAYQHRTHVCWCLGLGLLAVCLLCKYLFSTEVVLSKEGTDVASYFYHAYSLAFEELNQGHLVKWNPYVYGGQPFLGSFQSALLYPVTWFFIFWPVALALNWLVLVHVWLLGIGMYGWGVYRGMKPLAAFAIAVAMMLGGPFFIHIYAGHIPNLGSMAWVPLVFWGIDGWLCRRHAGWLLLSAIAAAMQIYAGHPQYFYYTAIVAGIYSLVFLIDAENKKRAAGGLLLIYPLAVLLAAAQLLPGLHATTESVRHGGANYEFASMFALPLENFFTLLVPWFFGDMETVPYWGKCYLWEMQLYCGVGILLLAIWGFGQSQRRKQIQFLILLGVIALLALGARTPLYQVLYEIMPGYGMFRGTSKFSFYLVLLLALMAGHGLTQCLEGRRPWSWLAWGSVGLGVILAIVSWSLQGDISNWFNNLLQGLAGSQESYLTAKPFAKDANVLTAQLFSARALLYAGLWLLVFGGIFLVMRRWPKAAWGLVAAMLLDSVIFVWPSITGFSVDKVAYKPVAEVLKQNPGDYRTLNLFNPESNISLRSEGIWGNNPFVLKRYAEFMFFSQGLNPDQASQNLPISRNTPLLALLRARIAFVPKEQGLTVEQLQNPFPRFLVVNKYRILHGRDAVLNALADPAFDPKKEVILEEDPLLPPDAGDAQYQIRLVSFSTDQWTLEVMTTRSSILVMTDAWSKDWQVTAFPGSVQTNYHVLPADYAFRAIPLAPGRHVIRIEYMPGGFYTGLLVSGLAWLMVVLSLSLPQLRGRLDFDGKLVQR